MSPRVLFFVGLAVLAVAMVNANDCPCGSGVDVCGCNPTVVRAQKVPKPCPCPRVYCARLNPPKYESADFCRCKQQHVAAAPKPPYRCLSCGDSYSPSRPCPCNNNPVATIPFTQDDFEAGYTHDDEPENPPAPGLSCGQQRPLSAADAVSLHIAYSNRPTQYVKEGGLSYGFFKTPEYQPITKPVRDINEEGLAMMRKKVLELRSPSNTPIFTEELPIEDEIEYGVKEPSGPSYAELGYLPENKKLCSITKLPKPCKAQEPMVYVGQSIQPGPSCNTCPYNSPQISYVEQSEEAHSDESEAVVGCGGGGLCGGHCGSPGRCGGSY